MWERARTLTYERRLAKIWFSNITAIFPWHVAPSKKSLCLAVFVWCNCQIMVPRGESWKYFDCWILTGGDHSATGGMAIEAPLLAKIGTMVDFGCFPYKIHGEKSWKPLFILLQLWFYDVVPSLSIRIFLLSIRAIGDYQSRFTTIHWLNQWTVHLRLLLTHT